MRKLVEWPKYFFLQPLNEEKMPSNKKGIASQKIKFSMKIYLQKMSKFSKGQRMEEWGGEESLFCCANAFLIFIDNLYKLFTLF